MTLTATDRAFLRGQFPGLRGLSNRAIQRWFERTHYGNNEAYAYDNESSDQ